MGYYVYFKFEKRVLVPRLVYRMYAKRRVIFFQRDLCQSSTQFQLLPKKVKLVNYRCIDRVYRA